MKLNSEHRKPVPGIKMPAAGRASGLVENPFMKGLILSKLLLSTADIADVTDEICFWRLFPLVGEEGAGVGRREAPMSLMGVHA